MAASQKKTGGKRTSSGGARRSGSASGSSRGNSRGSKAPARRPMRREIGAAVCLALALFAALGYFHIQAIFIDFFSGLLKGLLGYGFWLMPPALLLAAYILAFHRGRPVRLRLVCALMLPLIFSCLLHGLLVDHSKVCFCMAFLVSAKVSLPRLMQSNMARNTPMSSM